jgi:peptide/nickel transport system ATP-binding protein/nickel transport system ATP-binding protein
VEGIVAQQISHSYRDASGKAFPVLHDITLRLSPGECVALIGESGSGKSTVARLLLGLEQPSSGRVWQDGMDATAWGAKRWRKHRGSIQAVFQDASGTLNPLRSVYRNMEEGLINLTALNAVQRKVEVLRLMELFRMDQRLLKTPTRQLSGGEQRRASLVRALALRPRYLILDEVTSGLDAISTDAVLSTLESYRDRYGCAYLFITHDRACAHRIADRILYMKDGRLVREGTRIPPRESLRATTKMKENEE